MQKIITTAMLSFGIMALAQTGNVGINQQSPKATMQIDVANENASNDVNQGILIPQLSKQRIADIAQANLLDGTSGTNVKGANGLKTNKQHSAIGIVVRNGVATVTGDTKNR